MKSISPRLVALHMNTVVTPLSCKLIEPRPGQYDFYLLDGLLAQAQAAHMDLVFLWLAKWKNGISSYVPVRVKRDTWKYRRGIVRGRSVGILSLFDHAMREAAADVRGGDVAHPCRGRATEYRTDVAGGKRSWVAGRQPRPLARSQPGVCRAGPGAAAALFDGA